MEYTQNNIEALPYQYEDDLYDDCLRLVDGWIYLYYAHHGWVGPNPRLQSILEGVVSRPEFEQVLTSTGQVTAYWNTSDEERQTYSISRAYVAKRIAATEPWACALLTVFSVYALDEFQQNCVILALASVIDHKYDRLFAYLQDDITAKEPGLYLAAQLCATPDTPVAQAQARLLQNDSFCSLFDAAKRGEGKLALTPYLQSLFVGEPELPIPGVLSHAPTEADMEPLPIRMPVLQRLQRKLMTQNTMHSLLILRGAPGAGKRTLAKCAAARVGKRCIFLNVREANDLAESLQCACQKARLENGILAVYGVEQVTAEEEPKKDVLPDILAVLATERFNSAFLLLAEETRLPENAEAFALFTEVLPVPETDERFVLFSACTKDLKLAKDVVLKEIAGKFRFYPRQIVNAVSQASAAAVSDGKNEIDAALIHRCCYAQVVHKLGELATRVEAAYRWEDLVLPAGETRLLHDACAHVRYYHKVFEEWEFKKRITYGKGVSLLFSGQPGTGKTMAAQVIARDLHMQIYQIQLSQVVSKYIGETEKNLRAVFQEAKNSNSILFFDECDALFGKRGEVKDSNDRHANTETAYLLQQVEEHEGMTILATNLLQNIDPAFMRRIRFVVHFPFPDAAARKLLYQKMLLATMPVADDIDLDFLAEIFEVSGGGIKNIVMQAAFMAAAADKPIGMRQLLQAGVDEQKKNEIIVVREDLREYADLVF